jgi:hypothetical protein
MGTGCQSGVGEGITPEQLLIVPDQKMLFEWSRTAPYVRPVWTLHQVVKGAVAVRWRGRAARAGSAADEVPD